MLNKIWPIFIIVSIIYAIFSGNLEQLNNSIFESTESTTNNINTFRYYVFVEWIDENCKLI